MYMNSIQCYIANENLKLLDFKKMKLNSIREKYNKAFDYNNTSDHLYRIEVDNRDEFIKNMRGQSIVCGVHYDALHEMEVYRSASESPSSYDDICRNSSTISKRTVSIPFHEELDNNGQIEYIIEKVKRYGN